MYWERQLSDRLRAALAAFPSVLVTGPRQSGKTTFLKEELGSDYEYVTFDDPGERELVRSDPNGFLDQFSGRPVVLDEIQYVPELFSYLKMRIDAHRDRTGHWVMTGSQQFQLMKNISDSLAGRIGILELFPFHCGELVNSDVLDIIDLIWQGGYPSVCTGTVPRDAWLSGYIQTYVERDVRQLQNVQDLRLFETFLGLFAAGHAQVVNRAGISRKCGVSQPTVRIWEGILEASYVIRLLPPYFASFGKRLVKRPKSYFLDSAIAAYLTRQTAPATLWRGAMGGAFFEGWIVAEAYKVFAARGLRPDLYYWRSNDGMEIDLLVQVGHKLYPIEIKQTATPTSHHSEHLRRFRDIVGHERCEDGIVVL